MLHDYSRSKPSDCERRQASNPTSRRTTSPVSCERLCCLLSLDRGRCWSAAQQQSSSLYSEPLRTVICTSCSRPLPVSFKAPTSSTRERQDSPILGLESVHSHRKWPFTSLASGRKRNGPRQGARPSSPSTIYPFYSTRGCSWQADICAMAGRSSIINTGRCQ